MIDYRAAAEAYARGHAEMTADSIDAVVALCADAVVFHDPFNDTRGKAGLRHIFADMFQSTKDPRTEVLTLCGEGPLWFIKWRFRAGLPVIGEVDVVGLTELTLDETGLVTSHVDYWDAGPVIYGRLPVVGGIVRAVRKRLAAASRA
jgi:steroid delta-isomerase